jgi:CheY-like chemotaxis protein
MTTPRCRFEVSTAEDGQQGLDLMTDAVFDLVLCDIDMPVMDGLECIRSLRAWEEEYRAEERQLVCCVTGELVLREEEILSVGFDEVARKPYTKETVDELVARFELTPQVLTDES